MSSNSEIVKKLQEDIGEERLHDFFNAFINTMSKTVTYYKKYPERFYYDENEQLQIKQEWKEHYKTWEE